MADILIRGMELPTVCGRCPIEQFNEGFSWEMYCCPLIKDGYTTDIREVERRDDCPLHELPEHGYLIDRDALTKEINERVGAAIKWGVNAIADRDAEIKLRAEQAVATFCEASLTAKKLPTIVPASKEETK